MIRGLANMTFEKRLEELGLFTLEKIRQRGHLIIAFKYRKGCYRGWQSIAVCVHGQGDRSSNKLKRQQGAVRLDFTKNFPYLWQGLNTETHCSECGELPALEDFKGKSDKHLGRLTTRWQRLERGAGLHDLLRAFPTMFFCSCFL